MHTSTVYMLLFTNEYARNVCVGVFDTIADAEDAIDYIVDNSGEGWDDAVYEGWSNCYHCAARKCMLKLEWVVVGEYDPSTVLDCLRRDREKV